MHSHHTQSIQNVIDYFQRDPEVLALLLGGSIAHGFETPTSDVDIMIVVSDENHRKRLASNQVHFFNMDLCTYEGGYVDGKYTSLNFIKQVMEKGSEPARFAFAGSRILFSKINGLGETLEQVTCYPADEKAGRTIGISAYYELTEAARQRQKTDAFKKDYQQHRSGVEGSLSALVRGNGMRVSRYIGQKKRNLQAIFTGCAANLKRTARWLAGERPQTRHKKSWSLTPA